MQKSKYICMVLQQRNIFELQAKLLPVNSKNLFLVQDPGYSVFYTRMSFHRTSLPNTLRLSQKQFRLEYFSIKLQQISKFQLLIPQKKVILFIYRTTCSMEFGEGIPAPSTWSFTPMSSERHVCSRDHKPDENLLQVDQDREYKLTRLL